MRQTPPSSRITLPQWLAVAAIWGLAAYGVMAKAPAEAVRRGASFEARCAGASG